MSARRHTKFVREGSYAAEVDVELIEEDNGWSPYLSLDDARKLDERVSSSAQAPSCLAQIMFCADSSSPLRERCSSTRRMPTRLGWSPSRSASSPPAGTPVVQALSEGPGILCCLHRHRRRHPVPA